MRNTSRAAILPFPGDPFLLNYWLGLFWKHWHNEIDRLYIICNTPAEAPVIDYIRSLCTDSKIDLTYIDHQIQHGDAIKMGLEKATEEHVLLIEDDCFVFKPGLIDQCFLDLETGHYDIVGSKRGSCSMEILKRAADLWGIPYDGPGDQGCNFWPCLFFSQRHLLLATDRDYNARAWVQGELITPLHDYVVPVAVVSGDTFVNTSLQLHNMVPEGRIKYIPQYHAHPDDLKHYERRELCTPFDGRAGWTHIGSLSTGVSGLITDSFGIPLAYRLIKPPLESDALPNYCHTEMEQMEFERRVQFWLTFWENRETNKLVEFAELYKQGIDRIINQYHLRIKEIVKRQQVYREALGL